MNTKYCIHCGRKIAANARYCKYCGAKQQSTPVQSHIDSYTGYTENNYQSHNQFQPNMNPYNDSGSNSQYQDVPHQIPVQRDTSGGGFISGWKMLMHHMFQTYGCTSKHAYAQVMMPLLIITAVLGLVNMPLGDIAGLALIIIGWGANMRREHDIGMNNWLLIIIPGIEYIFMWVLCFHNPNPQKSSYFKQQAINHHLPPTTNK